MARIRFVIVVQVIEISLEFVDGIFVFQRVVSSATIPTSSTTDASSSDEAFQKYHAKLMELYGEDQANLVKKESIFQPRVRKNF